jgi:ADP-heptose:LPS heptosyltransferase/GT2 family glycosyltransferase
VTAPPSQDHLVLFKVEQPIPGFALHAGGVLSGKGWAIADIDIVEISIYLNETFLTYATHGLSRPDLAANFADYSDADHAGFAFSIPITQRIVTGLKGQDHLVLKLRTANGERAERIIPIASAAPGIPEATHSAQREPIQLAVESCRIDAQGLLRVHGWVVAMAPIVDCSMLLDDIALNPPQTNLRRADIAAAYTTYPNAETAGFMLVQDVTGLADRRANLCLHVHAADGQRRRLLTPIHYPAVAGQTLLQDDSLQICCDECTLMSDGTLVVVGWVLGGDAICEITVSFDRDRLGMAMLGQSRPDIANRFPRHPFGLYPGFDFKHRLPAPITGRHIVSLMVRDAVGRVRNIDLPTETAPNSDSAAFVAGHLAAPRSLLRLEIDTPPLAGDRATQPIRGRLTLSGWAIAQGGIDRVEIWLDAQKSGEAYLGQRRVDVDATFPDIEGALQSGFVMVLKSHALEPGWHTIRVLAVAKSGRSVERNIQIEVERNAPAPQGMLRQHVPQLETDQRFAIINATGDVRSFVILVYAASLAGKHARALVESLQSLQRQTYPNWRAVVWIMTPDPLSAAVQQAVAQCGEQVILHHAQMPPEWPSTPAGSQSLVCSLRAGDRLAAHALLELALEASVGTGGDFIYADEWRHDPDSGASQQWYKPDWAPELLLGTPYLGRAWCASATLIRSAGITPADLVELGSYDAALRLTELASEIRHVPQSLFAAHAPDTDAESAAEYRAGSAAEYRAGSASEYRALLAAIGRRGWSAAVREGRVTGTWQVTHALTDQPLVSIIIPTCAAHGLIENAVNTIRRHTDYRSVEIIIVDNIPATQPHWKTWLRDHADHVLDCPGPFNWSAFNNRAAGIARGAFLLFLNDDVETTDRGWLRQMLQIAQRSEIGAVGPKLLYPNGAVQHAGMFLSASHGLHAFRFLPGTEAGPFGLLQTQREVTAVTGACLLTRTEIFKALGGFNEAHSIINNDLDFCLRLGKAGYRVVYTPYATLTHRELASRAGLPDHYNSAQFLSTWRTHFLLGDRLFNPNLNPNSEQFLPEDEPVQTLYAGPPLRTAQTVRRILVIKLDHIGDFLTALPALRRLRQHFQSAAITLLAPNSSALLADLEPVIDDVIPFEFFNTLSSRGKLPIDEATYEVLQADLTRRQFDIAVDFRLQPDTRHILRLSGASILAGFDVAGRFPWLDVPIEWEGDARLLPKRTHVSQRLLLLADALGNVCCDEQGPVASEKRGGAEGYRLVCVHAGAGNAMKQWPAESYAGLIDLLVETHGVRVILIGSEDDREIVSLVLSHVIYQKNVESLAGLVSLSELASVIAPCALYIGNDSGPKHLAASLGVPTIGIHSGNIDATEWGPVGPRAVAIRRRVSCSPCYLARESDCPRALACLRGIRVQDVYRVARVMLEFA